MKKRKKNNCSFDKKRVRMKGQRIPRWYVRFLGRYHRKHKLIVDIDEQVMSPYTLCLQKYFGQYCAQIYDITAKILMEYRKRENELKNKIDFINEKMEAYAAALKTDSLNAAETKRYNENLYRQMNMFKEECECLKLELEEVRQEIRTSLLETEEMKYAKKMDTEVLLLNYVQGAKCFHESNPPRMQDDNVSLELYRYYCNDIDLKEAGQYVAQSI